MGDDGGNPGDALMSGCMAAIRAKNRPVRSRRLPVVAGSEKATTILAVLLL